jgi:hypothetical protein
LTASKAKGTRFESDIVGYLRSLGPYEVERLTMGGAGNDQGDIIVTEGGKGHCLIEAKDTTRISLPDWWRQATVERENYCKPRGLNPADVLACVVHKRRQAAIGDAWVTLPLKEFFQV